MTLTRWDEPPPGEVQEERPARAAGLAPRMRARWDEPPPGEGQNERPARAAGLAPRMRARGDEPPPGEVQTTLASPSRAGDRPPAGWPEPADRGRTPGGSARSTAPSVHPP